MLNANKAAPAKANTPDNERIKQYPSKQEKIKMPESVPVMSKCPAVRREEMFPHSITAKDDLVKFISPQKTSMDPPGSYDTSYYNDNANQNTVSPVCEEEAILEKQPTSFNGNQEGPKPVGVTPVPSQKHETPTTKTTGLKEVKSSIKSKTSTGTKMKASARRASMVFSVKKKKMKILGAMNQTNVPKVALKMRPQGGIQMSTANDTQLASKILGKTDPLKQPKAAAATLQRETLTNSDFDAEVASFTTTVGHKKVTVSVRWPSLSPMEGSTTLRLAEGSATGGETGGTHQGDMPGDSQIKNQPRQGSGSPATGQPSASNKSDQKESPQGSLLVEKDDARDSQQAASGRGSNDKQKSHLSLPKHARDGNGKRPSTTGQTCTSNIVTTGSQRGTKTRSELFENFRCFSDIVQYRKAQRDKLWYHMRVRGWLPSSMLGIPSKCCFILGPLNSIQQNHLLQAAHEVPVTADSDMFKRVRRSVQIANLFNNWHVNAILSGLQQTLGGQITPNMVDIYLNQRPQISYSVPDPETTIPKCGSFRRSTCSAFFSRGLSEVQKDHLWVAVNHVLQIMIPNATQVQVCVVVASLFNTWHIHLLERGHGDGLGGQLLPQRVPQYVREFLGDQPLS